MHTSLRLFMRLQGMVFSGWLNALLVCIPLGFAAEYLVRQ